MTTVHTRQLKQYTQDILKYNFLPVGKEQRCGAAPRLHIEGEKAYINKQQWVITSKMTYM